MYIKVVRLQEGEKDYEPGPGFTLIHCDFAKVEPATPEDQKGDGPFRLRLEVQLSHDPGRTYDWEKQFLDPQFVLFFMDEHGNTIDKFIW